MKKMIDFVRTACKWILYGCAAPFAIICAGFYWLAELIAPKHGDHA